MTRLRTLAALALAILPAIFLSPLNAMERMDAPPSAVAIFAAGCFWCVQRDFDKVEGVISTTTGYIGGSTPNPTYDDLALGDTGHAEAVRIAFDPARVSYRELIDYYWRHTDIVDGNGQFCDRGSQYRPAIFTTSPEQQMIAEESKASLQKSNRFKRRIAVEITPAKTFTPAEDEHQSFYKKNPIHYWFYRYGCGRDARLEQLWGADAGH